MHRSLVALLCLSLALIGCKGKEADISEDLQKKGTIDLMKEAAEDQYEGPADGKITEAQVKMYLKVREHEKKIAEVAKAEAKEHAAKAEKSGDKSLAGMMAGLKTLGSVADLATADIRAAKDLGFNSAEYLWVKERVLEVSGAAMAEKMGQAMNATMDSAYEQAKKAYAEASDETTKKMYAEMVKGYEQQREEMKKQAAEQDAQNPGLAHNRELLKKYGSELSAYVEELAKWSDEKVDTKKVTSEWEQQMDKATADAKKNQ